MKCAFHGQKQKKSVRRTVRVHRYLHRYIDIFDIKFIAIAVVNLDG